MNENDTDAMSRTGACSASDETSEDSAIGLSVVIAVLIGIFALAVWVSPSSNRFEQSVDTAPAVTVPVLKQDYQIIPASAQPQQ